MWAPNCFSGYHKTPESSDPWSELQDQGPAAAFILSGDKWDEMYGCCREKVRDSDVGIVKINQIMCEVIQKSAIQCLWIVHLISYVTRDRDVKALWGNDKGAEIRRLNKESKKIERWLKKQGGQYLDDWAVKVACLMVHPPLSLLCCWETAHFSPDTLRQWIKGAPTYEGFLAGLHVLLSVWLDVISGESLWWMAVCLLQSAQVIERDAVLL